MRKTGVCFATTGHIPSWSVCVCWVQGIHLLQQVSSHQISGRCIVRITFSDFAVASNTIRLLLLGENLRLIEVNLSPESPASRQRDRQAMVRPHGSHPVRCVTRQRVDKEEEKKNCSSARTQLKMTCQVMSRMPSVYPGLWWYQRYKKHERIDGDWPGMCSREQTLFLKFSEMLGVFKPTLSTPLQSAGAAALHPLTLTDLRKAGSVIGWRQETMGVAVMVVEEQDTEQTVINHRAAQTKLSATDWTESAASSPKGSDAFVVWWQQHTISTMKKKNCTTYTNLRLSETHGERLNGNIAQCNLLLFIIYTHKCT